MLITISKPLLIILVICLAIICICGLLIGILKVYQWWLDKKTKKYEVAIGRYDAELNRNNRCLAKGKWIKGGCEWCLSSNKEYGERIMANEERVVFDEYILELRHKRGTAQITKTGGFIDKINETECGYPMKSIITVTDETSAYAVYGIVMTLARAIAERLVAEMRGE